MLNPIYGLLEVSFYWIFFLSFGHLFDIIYSILYVSDQLMIIEKDIVRRNLSIVYLLKSLYVNLGFQSALALYKKFFQFSLHMCGVF